MPVILGIESSCDETSVALVADGRVVLANIIATQHDLHAKYGGVVPEIASRAHLERILPVLDEALATAHLRLRDLDAVAVGNRPGLIGSLLVGVSAAKALAWALDRPLVGVDHVQAHLYASCLQEPTTRPDQKTEIIDPRSLFPALGLVVSGGHSSLYHVEAATRMRLLGRTIDDSVGEAYDKAAVILYLGYPGGPKLDKLAQTGDPRTIDLPKSLLDRDSLDFSFSGLKTALLYKVRGFPKGRGPAATFERSGADLTPQEQADYAAAFQDTAIGILMTKLQRALEVMTRQGTPARAILIGGGVSANSLLRRRVAELGQARKLHVGIPKMSYCLDNAAMIAGLAHEDFLHHRFDDLNLPAVATMAQ